ncbi:porin family protein [Aquimarina sp. 2201CG1-2-11]|uniref:porin family protein n=1 Tax=Aquimarina discodermiae TaxID=3231043 RepID=UPI003462035B
MKKLLLFAVLTSLSLVSNAQEEEIRFGAKAGINFATITGDETDNVGGKTGFHVGAVVEIPLSEKFAFQPEILYSTQGSKYESSFEVFNETTTEETTTKLNYLNIPLIGKFYIVEGFSLQAGPKVGFLLSAKREQEDTDSEGTETEDVDIKDTTKGLDFGVNFGLGYQMDMGLFFDARYNLGLSNINDIEGSSAKNQNNVIQLSIGYKF